MKITKGVQTVMASFAIQLVLGICYIWSVFQTGIAESIFGGNHAAAALSFSLILLGLSIFSPVAGKLAAKYSTRIVVFGGGLLISAGFFVASMTTPEFPWLLWLSYGVMAGVGMGFTYSTTIALAQRWYPHRKGLVTAIIVSALGFGGVVFTPLVENWIAHFGGVGVGELPTFMVIGVIFLVVCSIGSIFLHTPPEVPKKAGSTAGAVTASVKDYTASEMLRNVKFYLIVTTMFLSVIGGLMMIGFARPIAVARGLEATATIGVLAITMFNSFGRLFWGTLSDKLGRMNTIMILLIGSGLLSMSMTVVDGYWIYVVIGLIGFCFGGFLSTFPPLTADVFGVKNLATNYGFVLFGFGIGAVAASQLGGFYQNLAREDISLMSPAFMIAAACAFVGLGLMLSLKVLVKKRGY